MGPRACNACCAYADEECENETTTESESELVGTPALTAYLGSFEGETSESLLNSSLLAKARFRHFTGRATRRTRFPRFHAQRWRGKGKGRGKRNFSSKGRRGNSKGRPSWSFKGSSLTPRALAGGKGGKPGQWSARKAQMLAKEYKAKGGGYR